MRTFKARFLPSVILVIRGNFLNSAAIISTAFDHRVRLGVEDSFKAALVLVLGMCHGCFFNQ